MPIAIIGAPRSGTSATARVLNICGVYLGEGTLNGMDDHQPTGFWEHDQVIDLNVRVMRALFDFPWPRIVPADWRDQPGIPALLDEARALVKQAFSDGETWGWKDPRTTLVLPFWQEVVPDLRHVVCIRNPLDVAASLSARYSEPTVKMVKQWCFYMEAALYYTEPDNRVLIHYEDLMADWRAAIAPVLVFLGLSMPKSGSEAEKQIAAFLNRDLKHHSHSLEDLLNSPDASAHVRELYETLVKRPRDVDVPPPLLRHARLALAQAGMDGERAASDAEHLEAQIADLRKETEYLSGILASPPHRIAASCARIAGKIPVVAPLLRSGLGRAKRSAGADPAGLPAPRVENSAT